MAPTQYKPTALAVWTYFTRRGPSMAPLRLPGLRPEFNPAFQASSPTQYKPTALAVWTAGGRTSRWLFLSELAQQPAVPSLSRGAFIGVCHNDCRAPNPIQAHGASRVDLLHAARAIHGPASLAGPPPGIQPGLPGLVSNPIQAHGASRVDCGWKDIPLAIFKRARPTARRPLAIARGFYWCLPQRLPRTQPNTSPRR